MRQLLQPFADLGVVGANSIQNRNYSKTDSRSFNLAGLPGIRLAQDPIEYETDTWHTNLDTYERVLEGDLETVRHRGCLIGLPPGRSKGHAAPL